MSGLAFPWFVAAAGAGVGQAFGLWLSARNPRAVAWSAALRLTLLAAVLLIAARAGELIPAASGWICGLTGGGFLLYRRRTA